MQRPLLLSFLLAACAADSSPGVDGPFPASGEYASRYRVPTTEPALEAAAIYPLDHVDWTVSGDLLTLHYDLPEGLVGGKLDVTFTGTLTPGSDTVDISGPNGVGTCTVAQSTVTCLEDFANLGALPISSDVVSARAAIEYSGPVSDRIRLALVFGSDPIGILELDASAIDDSDD